MQNGMEFCNGCLVVFVKGFYYLYGFLDFYQFYGNEVMVLGMLDFIIMRFYKFNILKFKEEVLIEIFCFYERLVNKCFMIYQFFFGVDVEFDVGDEVYLKVLNLIYIKNLLRNVFGFYML